MALQEDQHPWFVELKDVYPKWPVGRTVTRLAADKFRIAMKLLEFTREDIDAIKLDIIDKTAHCASWQKGSRFGPPGLQKYFHQRLWNEGYKRTKTQHAHQSETETSDEANRKLVANLIKYDEPVPESLKKWINQ